MEEEEEFFAGSEKREPKVSTPDGMVDPELITSLKEYKEEMNMTYSKLIANPYLAPTLVDDTKSTLLRTIAVLMENNIPLQLPGKERTAEDVVTESLAELGGLLGAKGAIAMLRAKKGFKDAWKDYRESDDFVIYEDENGEFYFLDPEDIDLHEDERNEIPCDEYGNPLEYD